MALFGRNPAPVDDDMSSAYLAMAQPGPRTTALAASCVVLARELPIAGAQRFRELLTVSALEPASRLVRDVMASDRDLSAWVARKSLVQFKSVAAGPAMRGQFADNFDLGLAAVGLAAPGAGVIAVIPGAGTGLSQLDRDGATGFGGVAIALLETIVAESAARSRTAGWSVYEDLYIGASGEDVETLAYDITAWTAVMLARLLNAGHIAGDLPLFGAAYRVAPPLNAPGWYPNPANHGGVASGVAPVQRFWDGAWSDRIRVRQGRSWTEHEASLHLVPPE